MPMYHTCPLCAATVGTEHHENDSWCRNRQKANKWLSGPHLKIGDKTYSANQIMQLLDDLDEYITEKLEGKNWKVGGSLRHIEIFGGLVNHPLSVHKDIDILVNCYSDFRKVRKTYDLTLAWCRQHRLPVHIWVKSGKTVFNPLHPELTEVFNPQWEDTEVRCPTCEVCPTCHGGRYIYLETPKKKNQISIMGASNSEGWREHMRNFVRSY